MSDSLVNPSNINSSFPLAGQNNPSQGFRDNFAAIKSALSRAATELSELRDNSMLKSAVDGVTFDNDLSYNRITRAQLKSFSETFYDNGYINYVFNLNYANGNFQKIATTAPFVIAFSNFPPGAQIGRVIVWITCTHVDHKMGLPGTVLYGTNANYISNREITFPSIGHYLIEFLSVNNGQNYWIMPVSGLAEFAGTGGTGAGTGPLTLPVASTTVLGGVKIDGDTIAINNGVISVVGTLSSDIRLKENVEVISNALAINRTLNGVSFRFKENQQDSIGLIAQDVERVLPELVHENSKGYKTLEYANLAGVFVECIKTLEEKIQILEQTVKDLQDKLDSSQG